MVRQSHKASKISSFMDISLDKGQGQYRIHSYKNGVIRINQQDYRQPVLLELDKIQQEHLCSTASLLDLEMLKSLKISDYEIFILGTGPSIEFPDWDLLEQAQVLGTPIEVMNTSAACRTYTVLASEGRQVLALLFP